MSKWKEDSKIFNDKSKYKVKCKCGCSTVMTKTTDRCICRWCQHWLYRTPAIEFKYKLKEKLWEGKNEN